MEVSESLEAASLIWKPFQKKKYLKDSPGEILATLAISKSKYYVRNNF